MLKKKGENSTNRIKRFGILPPHKVPLCLGTTILYQRDGSRYVVRTFAWNLAGGTGGIFWRV